MREGVRSFAGQRHLTKPRPPRTTCFTSKPGCSVAGCAAVAYGVQVNQVRKFRQRGWLAWNEQHIVTGESAEQALSRLETAGDAKSAPEGAVSPAESGNACEEAASQREDEAADPGLGSASDMTTREYSAEVAHPKP